MLPTSQPHRLFGFLSCLAALLTLAGCASRPETATAPNPATTSTATASASTALFRDVAAKAGVNFQHQLGDDGHFYLVENTAPGCAFFDYDNDGFLDIFLVQSGSSAPPATVRNRPHCALYRNNRNGTFTDVTRGSGFDRNLGYAQGVAAGDYDNDGYEDLFITSYNQNFLFHNRQGSGQFEDVTQKMGMGARHGTGYATSAAWGDYDNDGRLDLYVCYYLKWDHQLNRQCRNKENGKLDYCSPVLYDPVPHQLWHNDGKKFSDVSLRAGIGKKAGHGLAVAFLDYDGDGRQDIFVANDLTPIMLWRNNGNGTFKDVAVEAGCAYGEEGKVMAAMGITTADYDRSGRQSIYVSNFSGRPNVLFKNQGSGFYEDATQQAQIGLSHHHLLSFGCEFLDYDADGWPDLLTNNGHVEMNIENRDNAVAYKQPKQLLHNQNGRFQAVEGDNSLGDLALPVVGRGLATGDFDNDGFVDVLAVSQNGRAQLLRNTAREGNHWVSFHLIGTKSNRDGAHARLTLRSGKARQIATVRAGSSYLSSSDRRVYFGLKDSAKIEEVVIQWPSGQRDVLRDLAANQFYTVTEGRGLTQKRALTTAAP